jgi:hypothetical protein
MKVIEPNVFVGRYATLDEMAGSDVAFQASGEEIVYLPGAPAQ